MTDSPEDRFSTGADDAPEIRDVNLVDDEIDTRALLAIVNSRDPAAIMGLQGFGPKRARDLVEYLRACGGDDQGGDETRIRSLAQLRSVPGLGDRAIARACEGLAC